MRNRWTVLAGIAAMTLAGTGAWAAEDERQDPAAQGGAAQQTPVDQAGSEREGPRAREGQRGEPGAEEQQAPDGFVLIQERVVFLMGNAPQQHLLASLDKMHQDNRRAAAGEIRQAAAYVEMQASRARGDGADALNRAAKQLNKLAGQVEQKEAKVSAEQLTKAFAQTGHALAKHHQVLAERALEKDRHLQAGYELEASARALQQALIWSGQQPEQEVIGTLQNALAAAYELRNEKFPADEQQQQQQSDGEASPQEGEAQPASAREQAAGADPGDPRTGTTRAEGQNIQQHAKLILKGLDEDIQQLGKRLKQSGRSGEGSQQDSSQPNEDAQQQPQRDEEKEQQEQEQEQQQQ